MQILIRRCDPLAAGLNPNALPPAFSSQAWVYSTPVLREGQG